MKINHNMIARVDSHHHFWELSRGDYDWLTPELTNIYRDFLPNDIIDDLRCSDVTQTILVQAAASEDETRYLLRIAETTDFVKGVVGWVNMESNNALKQLEKFSTNPYFKGIRPMLQDIKNVNWILNDQFDSIFKFLGANNLTFDALISEVHLANIDLIAKKHPDIKMVINHCAKPSLSTAPSKFWLDAIRNISSRENVHIKFSGLFTEAPTGKVEPHIIKPFFEHVLECFGAGRIMWGSDWPVIKLNGDYHSWLDTSDYLLQGLPFELQHKVWAQNARQFYNLT
ncbi:amidohydrolase [Thalassotalea maritima]|uniref:amidohydrolase family protein n=1 Tax=Thalassotalea maritima TaxID=3242416 RepID=UPI0035278358